MLKAGSTLAPGEWVRLPSAPEWGLGQVQSVAGIRVTVNFEHAGETVDYARWPNLSRYVAAIHARPSFKALIDEERPICDRVRAA